MSDVQAWGVKLLQHSVGGSCGLSFIPACARMEGLGKILRIAHLLPNPIPQLHLSQQDLSTPTSLLATARRGEEGLTIAAGSTAVLSLAGAGYF